MLLQLAAALKIWSNPARSADEMRALQSRQLRKLVARAYATVPFYRKLFDDHGLVPADIREIEDLEHLPLLSKQTIRDAAEQLISSRYKEGQLIRRRTGGSTGTPLSIYTSRRSAALDSAAKLRTYVRAGYKPHFKIAVAQHAQPKGKMFHKLGIHREIGVPYNRPIEEQVRQIAELKTEVIDAQPNRIELISRYLLATSTSLDRVKIVFTHSEKITDSQRNLVRRAFGLNLIDCYGCSESAAIAAECPAHEGYHINSDLVILETVPIDDVHVDSSMKRIVVTNLNNFAMPLIRYEVGDLGALSAKRCSCGNNFPLLAEIAGRTNDLVTLPSGEKVSGYALARAIEEHQEVLQYRAIQRRCGEFEISLILADGAVAPEASLHKRLAADFPGVRVVFRYPDEIPLSPRGKLCRFESEYGA
ncbi:MAG TPA: hypothetical protein VML01_11920 [Bryobacterales bacterium]|nr:hypothetical protein [Bryobacterales bacterium]